MGPTALPRLSRRCPTHYDGATEGPLRVGCPAADSGQAPGCVQAHSSRQVAIARQGPVPHDDYGVWHARVRRDDRTRPFMVTATSRELAPRGLPLGG